MKNKTIRWISEAWLTIWIVFSGLLACQGGGDSGPDPIPDPIEEKPTLDFQSAYLVPNGFSSRQWVAPNGDIYLAGALNLPFILDDLEILPSGMNDYYFAKINADGTFAWASAIKATYVYDASFVFDPQGGVYFSGSSFDAMELPGDNGPFVLTDPTVAGARVIFVGKLNPNSGNFVWVQSRLDVWDASVSFLQDALYLSYASVISLGAAYEKINAQTGAMIWKQDIQSNNSDFVGLKATPDKIYAYGRFLGDTLNLPKKNGAAVNGVALTNNFPGSESFFFGELDPMTGAFLSIGEVKGSSIVDLELVCSPSGDGIYLLGAYKAATSVLIDQILQFTTPVPMAKSVDAFLAKMKADGSFDWLTFIEGEGKKWPFSDNQPIPPIEETVALFHPRGLVESNDQVCIDGKAQNAVLKTGSFQLDSVDGVYTACFDFSTGTPLFISSAASLSKLTQTENGDLYWSVRATQLPSLKLKVKGVEETFVNTGAAFQTSDAFIAKIANNGDFDWVFYLGTESSDRLDLAVSASGRLIVTGSSADAEPLKLPNLATPLDSSAVSFDAFVGELDPLNGQLLWAKPFDAEGFERLAVIPDPLDRLLIKGEFHGKANVKKDGQLKQWDALPPGDFNPFIGILNPSN